MTKSNPKIEVKVSLHEGPLIIKSVGKRGAKNEFQMWNDIIAREYFPPAESAFYQLELVKPVTSRAEVFNVEGELSKALKQLSLVWHFSGGYPMVLVTSENRKSTRFESNASQVEEHFLSMEGKKTVGKSMTVQYSIEGYYEKMPLSVAIKLCHAAGQNLMLENLFGYFYIALTEKESWFVHAFKACEVLERLHGGEKKMRSSLQISRSDWRLFGEQIDDLRHARRIKSVPDKLRSEDVHKLIGMLKKWIETYLTKSGLFKEIPIASKQQLAKQ